jgi:hypothetical protein
MQFRRTIPNYGARDPLETFECAPCNTVLNIPPKSEAFDSIAL